jgi:UDP-N-acetylmuramoylalanine--D-glutamate ligase
MISLKKLKKKNFAIYGLGLTGLSVINLLKKNKIKNFYAWDDKIEKRKKLNLKISAAQYSQSLNKVDYIVISPGINLDKSKFKKNLIKNKNKIITDIDLFYILNKKIKSIVVTGTNGKSTTCKILEHLLKKNKFNVNVCGNIGKPILSLKLQKNSIIIIEASSFQLSYSKFIRPHISILLNLSKDHLDWHKNMQNYINSKMKIFLPQERKDYALLSDKKLIKIFKKRKYLGNLKKIKKNKYNKIKIKIKNEYLISKVNEKNMNFVYEVSKILKIKEKNFLKSFKDFKGLEHRHEVIYKKKKIIFINDSKATSFEASKYALESNNNIFWIVGGLPKLGDIFYSSKVKENIIRTYIIGKNLNFYQRQLKNKVKYSITKTLDISLKMIFKELIKRKEKAATVLLSPASASFDQYKNFEERGLEFKKLVKLYANRYL